MDRKLPDIVTDTRLESEVHADHTIHCHHVPDPNARRRPKKVEERWRRERELGSGGYATVWLETCVAGSRRGQCRAVKEIKRGEGRRLPSSEFARELEAVGKFSQRPYRHCFVRSFGWYETESRVFVAMEYLEQGDLHRYLCQPFPEAEAIAITHQLLEGLRYMHEAGFAHRDLKPKNILVHIPRPNWWVKIADFGISKRIHESTGLRTAIGTEGYMAPEVTGIFPKGYREDAPGLYTLAVDIWAIGTIAWRMITNRPAFPTQGDLVSYIFKEKPLSLISTALSSECNDFVEKTLAASASRRPTSEEALQHPWIRLCEGQITMLEHETEEEPDVSLAPKIAPASWSSMPTTNPKSAGEARKDGHEAPTGTSRKRERQVLSGKLKGILKHPGPERAYRQTSEGVDKTLGKKNGEAPQNEVQQQHRRSHDLGPGDYPSRSMSSDFVHDQRREEIPTRQDSCALRYQRYLHADSEPLTPPTPLRFQRHHTDGEPLPPILPRSPFAAAYRDSGDETRDRELDDNRINGDNEYHPRAGLVDRNADGKDGAQKRHSLHAHSDNNHAYSVYIPGPRHYNREKTKPYGLDGAPIVAPLMGTLKDGQEGPGRLETAHGLTGKLGEAEPLLRQALEARERSLGGEHPDTLTNFHRLAGALEKQGRYGEAESLFRQALRGKEKVLGGEHPDTLKTLHQLAGVLEEQEQHSEAEWMCRRALRGRKKVLGKGHADTVKTTHFLADVMRGQNKWAEAGKMYTRAFRGWGRILGRDHPRTLLCAHRCGDALYLQGEDRKANEMYRWAFDGRKIVLGEGHRDTQASAYGLARGLGQQGKTKQAGKNHQFALR